MQFEEVVSAEMATEEVNEWLNYRKVLPSRRREFSANIETMVEALQYGLLAINSTTKEITQKLLFPLSNPEGEVTVKELSFKPRVTDEMVRQKMQNVKGTDFMGIQRAYLSAITDTPAGVLARVETSDLKISNAIVGFFL